MNDEVCLEVWGDFACFAPPYGKVERLTYPVPTLRRCGGFCHRFTQKNGVLLAGDANRGAQPHSLHELSTQ